MKHRILTVVRVHRSILDPWRGRLVAGPLAFPCTLGRSGPIRRKREGDGGTPIGRFRILGAYFRSDRITRPHTGLPLRRLRPSDGWCDDPKDRRYNRLITLPIDASHERMWRDDSLYDVVIDIAWNRGPIVRQHGSAIFLHVAKPSFAPTEGCIAVERRMIDRLLERIGQRTWIEIVG